ncbi:MAG: hexose kinase [Tepidisphaeraceae bacterium]
MLCLGTTPSFGRTMRFKKLTLDEVNRTADVREYAAGKAPNVARAARTMGGEPLVLGFVGGHRATPMRESLDAENIRHAFLDVASPLRLCTTIVDDATGSATELVEEASPVTHADGEALLVALERQLRDQRVLVISGALVKGLDPDFTARCVQLARDAGVMTVLDGSGEALRLALPHRPAVVKVNRSELAGTLGEMIDSDDALLAAMRRVSGVTQGWVIVTQGSDSTFAVNGTQTLRASVPKVTLVSPIGSGDSFAAGVGLGLERGFLMPETLQLATAMASANAETADAASFESSRMLDLSKQVRVE